MLLCDNVRGLWQDKKSVSRNDLERYEAGWISHTVRGVLEATLNQVMDRLKIPYIYTDSSSLVLALALR